MEERARDDLICAYFNMGYSYNLIICFLATVHGIKISLASLKRALRTRNLRRRRHNFSISLLRQALSVST